MELNTCSKFIANSWRPHKCRECFHSKEEHGIATSIPMNNQNVGSDEEEQNSSETQIPCSYGTECYRKNPEHFKKCSHPSKNENISSANLNSGVEMQQQIDNLKKQLESQRLARIKQQKTDLECMTEKLRNEEAKIRLEEQRKTQMHLELVEQRFRETLAGVENEKILLEKLVDNLRKDKDKIAMHHQQLEKALQQECEDRERREIQRVRIFEINRDPPSYWGINAFDELYRKINISPKSSEFRIVSDLLNGTIATHNNRYGTVNKKDPTQFIVTNVIRILNKRLWQKYCYYKESIMEKYQGQLANYDSSKYLRHYQCLVPLLDSKANEYWLFHGCSKTTLPKLLEGGYDTRMATLEGMFGGGFYLAENSSKSNQYIPCPGCGNNAISYDIGCNCKKQEDLEFSIILYRAVLGDVHIAKKYDKKIYRGKEKAWVRRPPTKENSDELYDSIMGEKVEYGGDKLMYREFILYESGQAYPEYVITYRRSATNARTPSDIERMKNKCYNFFRNTFKLRPE